VSASSAHTIANAEPSTVRAAASFRDRPRLTVESAVGRFIDNDDLLWASALTYTTALSIVLDLLRDDFDSRDGISDTIATQ
jgi:hypothetical protein